MLRTSAVSLFALATAMTSVQAQTILYGEQPLPPPAVFSQPQPQPFFIEPQPVPQPAAPLYYETTPAVQPRPTVPLEPTRPGGSFQPVPLEPVTPTRPLPPVQRYQPSQAAPTPAPVLMPPAAIPAPAPSAPVEAMAPPPAPTPVPEARMTESEALRDFSQELSRIVSLGERYRAASPGFLEDLKALAERYATLPVRAEPPPAPTPPTPAEPAPEAELIGPPPPADLPATAPATEEPPQTELALLPETDEPAALVEPLSTPEAAPQELPQALPPTSAAVVYLRDDFSDGEYVSNPSWNVRQGQFTIDPAFGLRPFSPETSEPAQVTPQALLQYLIGDSAPQTPAPTGDSGAALIEAQAPIGNAFSLVTTITDHGGEGAAHFILHQGGANWLGYRLELRAGPRPLVVLARRGSSGYKDIMKVEAPGFTTGKPHQLRWARLSDGQMFVLIDGRPIITARDTVFRQGWQGFAYFTADADISMRNIRIAEPVER